MLFHQQAVVQQCYVRCDKTTLNERLVAYIEVADNSIEQERQLRQNVAEVLPAYMILSDLSY